MNPQSDGMRALTVHGRRIWRWASFDPPMRHPGLGGACTRKVSCLACGQPVGSSNDPIDALLMAWRHRKTGRTGAGA